MFNIVSHAHSRSRSVPVAQHAIVPGSSGDRTSPYPTAGLQESAEEAQRFLRQCTLWHQPLRTRQSNDWGWELRESLCSEWINSHHTNSDSEVLLTRAGHELPRAANGVSLDEGAIFKTVTPLTRRVKRRYAPSWRRYQATVCLAFRDPHGNPSIGLGQLETGQGTEWIGCLRIGGPRKVFRLLFGA